MPPLGAKQEPINAFIRGLEGEEQRAEAFRLLYVGLTRAKDELHLCMRRRFDKAGELRMPSSSFLGMLRASLHDPVFDAPSPARAAQPPPAALSRRRLRADSLPPAPPPLATQPVPPPAVDEWASPTAKHVGTVTHLLLELVGAQGLAAWPVETLEARRGFVRQELAMRGVPHQELEPAASRVLLAIANTLASERGRWIFDERHADRASERHYTALVDGGLIEAVLDRTFIDGAGTRWIVDFKTSEPGRAPLDAFLAAEVERYREQLERYARLLRMLEDRPLALGLYFPSCDGWVGWRWDG